MNYYVCPETGTVLEGINGSLGNECLGGKLRPLSLVDYPAFEEKHVPVLEFKDGRLNVKVGKIEHPMQPEHHIVFIEACYNGFVLRKKLNPGEAPWASFSIPDFHGQVEVYAFCNIHGLWKNSITI